MPPPSAPSALAETQQRAAGRPETAPPLRASGDRARGKEICRPTSQAWGRLVQVPPGSACRLCAGRDTWGAGGAPLS